MTLLKNKQGLTFEEWLSKAGINSNFKTFPLELRNAWFNNENPSDYNYKQNCK